MGGRVDIYSDFKIDFKSPCPIYEQIKQGIKILILSGNIEKGEKVIPVREMARILGVNVNTVVKSYYQLSLDGYLYSRKRQGYYVIQKYSDKREETKKLFDVITRRYLQMISELGLSKKDVIAKLKNVE